MRIDEGGGGPTLNPKAKQYERELFKIFAVQTGSIAMTQTDWQSAKKQLEDLAKDVKAVHGELQAPADGSKGWSGPAATAALSSLKKLSDALDTHAGEVGQVDASLGQVYTAVSDAISGWYSDVASISTYVNPDDHKRLPAPYLPTADNAAKYSIRDPEAAAAAEDALWQQRNLAAKGVLDQLAGDTDTAKQKMPLEVKDDKQTPYNNEGPASANRTSGTATQSGADVHPTGSTVGTGGLVHPTTTGTTTETGVDYPPVDTGVQTGTVSTEGPGLTPGTYDPISSDGDVTGSTGLTPGGGSGGSSGAYPTGGGTGGGGIGAGGVAAGGIGGAAGLGGIMRGGGMFSAGGTSRTGGMARSGGVSSAGRSNSAAGSRGSALRAGGTGRAGAMGAGGGSSARGGASARGSAVKGATGSGKYGVPKVGAKGAGPVGSGGQGAKGAGKAGGRGTGGRGSAANGAAGRGGSRKGDKNGQPQDVDKLTHADEEAWFDGTEEAGPQVWE